MLMKVYQEFDSCTLVEQCRRGDSEALRTLYVRNYAPMLDTARHYVDDDTARDVVHDSFLMALASLDSLRDSRRIEAWLIRIVRNMAINHVKHEQVLKLQPIEMVQDIVPAEQRDEPLVPLDVLMAMVGRLPSGYEQVFRLRTLVGLTHDEISRQLGITSSTSRSQYTHARRMLQSMVQHWWMGVLIITMGTLLYLQFNKTAEQQGINSSTISKTVKQPTTSENQQREPMKTAPQQGVNRLMRTADEAIGTPSGYSPDSVVEKQQDEQISKDSLKHEQNQPQQLLFPPLTIAPISKQVFAKEESRQQQDEQISKDSLKHEQNQPQQLLFPPLTIAPISKQVFAKEESRQQQFNPMSISLTFSGLPDNNDLLHPASITAIPTLDITSEEPSTASFDNWMQYLNFIDEEALINPTEENQSLRRIAASNASGNPQQQIEEHTHHDVPFSISLSLNKAVDWRWSLGTGLNYTRLHSTFDLGYSRAFIRNEQTIHYLGVPVNASYTFLGRDRWKLFGTAGATLDIPVGSSLSIRHVLDGQNIFKRSDKLQVPLQWSVNVGVGLQFNLTPNIGIFAQPSVNYYFNNGTKTIRSEHPWSVTMPVGLRYTW